MYRRGAVVIGASSGVGRAIAEKLSESKFDLVIVARDERDLNCLADHLVLCNGGGVSCYAMDLSEDHPDEDRFFSHCKDTLAQIDAIFAPVGFINENDEGIRENIPVESIARVNFLNVVRVIAPFARLFEGRGWGQIVGFSSIAASAPRKRNILYAASKSALEVYLLGLRHYFAHSRVIVQCYILGYVDTAWTFGKPLWFPAVKPAKVAKYVVAHLERDMGNIYYPRYWKYIVGILRNLPWWLYKRLDF